MMNKLRMGLGTLCLLILAPVVANAAPLPGLPSGWSDGYAYVNGIRIHYWRAVPAPGKPVLVMVHGVTDIGLTFARLAWKLQTNYDCYLLDTRGHGYSDSFTPSDNGDTLIKDVVGFVQKMKFEKPILLGHSMGAATVMRVGAEYPDLAKAIVMLDPGLPRAGGAGAPGGRRGGPATAPGALAGRGGAGRGAGRGAPGRGAAPSTAPAEMPFPMFGDPDALVASNNYDFAEVVALAQRQNPKWDLVDDEYWALAKKLYHGPFSNEGQQAMSGSMATGDSLAKITVPALILKADASPEVRKANEEAAKVMQKGTLVHIDGAAHNVHRDQLDRCIQELTSFLSKL
jgi:pimeloyl-ACP methyl ester carboxylesterase